MALVYKAGFSVNSPNSDSAGQAAALVIRKRTFVVVTGSARTSRQLPILVPEANSIHLPSCHRSSAKGINALTQRQVLPKPDDVESNRLAEFQNHVRGRHSVVRCPVRIALPI